MTSKARGSVCAPGARKRRMGSCSRHGTALLCAVTLSVGAGEARASGLYFSDRGVRPLGRGGAFVAGADDLGAIWYNPAGGGEGPPSPLIRADVGRHPRTG